MAIEIENKQGNPVSVFVRNSGGYIDAIVRASTKEAFEIAALSENLMVQQESEDGSMVNVPAPDVNIDVIGPITLTPATFDENGNELTAATMDNRYHVNLRIGGKALEAETDGFPNWKQTAINWTLYGTPDVSNATEDALVLSDVALIDPDTINSPSRVWA